MYTKTNRERELEREQKSRREKAAAVQYCLLHCSKNLHSIPQPPHNLQHCQEQTLVLRERSDGWMNVERTRVCETGKDKKTQ